MHHTAALILQLLEEYLRQESAEERRFYQKLIRLVCDLGFEAAELECQVREISAYGMMDDVA